MTDQARDRVAERLSVTEGHENSSPRGQQILGVSVRGGDHRTSRRHREGQRSRHDLFAFGVGRDEDIGGTEEFRQFLHGQKSVVEHDVISDAELLHSSLQPEPIRLAVATRDFGMGPTGDDEDHFRMICHHRGHGVDGGFETLPRREQTERGHHETTAGRGGTPTRSTPQGYLHQ